MGVGTLRRHLVRLKDIKRSPEPEPTLAEQVVVETKAEAPAPVKTKPTKVKPVEKVLEEVTV